MSLSKTILCQRQICLCTVHHPKHPHHLQSGVSSGPESSVDYRLSSTDCLPIVYRRSVSLSKTILCQRQICLWYCSPPQTPPSPSVRSFFRAGELCRLPTIVYRLSTDCLPTVGVSLKDNSVSKTNLSLVLFTTPNTPITFSPESLPSRRELCRLPTTVYRLSTDCLPIVYRLSVGVSLKDISVSKTNLSLVPPPHRFDGSLTFDP